MVTIVRHVSNREEDQVNSKSARKRITNSTLKDYV